MECKSLKIKLFISTIATFYFPLFSMAQQIPVNANDSVFSCISQPPVFKFRINNNDPFKIPRQGLDIRIMDVTIIKNGGGISTGIEYFNRFNTKKELKMYLGYRTMGLDKDSLSNDEKYIVPKKRRSYVFETGFSWFFSEKIKSKTIQLKWQEDGTNHSPDCRHCKYKRKRLDQYGINIGAQLTAGQSDFQLGFKPNMVKVNDNLINLAPTDIFRQSRNHFYSTISLGIQRRLSWGLELEHKDMNYIEEEVRDVINIYIRGTFAPYLYEPSFDQNLHFSHVQYKFKDRFGFLIGFHPESVNGKVQIRFELGHHPALGSYMLIGLPFSQFSLKRSRQFMDGTMKGNNVH